MLVLEESVEWVVIFLAAARLGAVVVATNPYLPPREHRAVLNQSGPDLAISAKPLANRFGHTRWIDIERLVTEAKRARALPAEAIRPEAPLYVQFTSGTTGKPKGAIHKQSDLRAYQTAVGEAMLQITEQDVSISTSKIYSPYGFGNLFVYPLFTGSTGILRRGRLTSKDVVEALRMYRPTILYSIPSIYSDLSIAPTASDFRGLRVAVSAGEPLSAAQNEAAQAMMDTPLLNELGSTEVGGAFCANTLAGNVPGTVGRPLLGYELELRDDANVPLGPTTLNEQGHLWVRGPTIMVGYVSREHGSIASQTDAWLETGDLALRRADGRFVVLGRGDDIEIIGGLNLSPLEVEEVLATHPAVADVAVAAMVKPSGHRELRAFVVPSRKASNHADVAEQLIDLARENLAAHKVPVRVIFLDSLPRTDSGKVTRLSLRNRELSD